MAIANRGRPAPSIRTWAAMTAVVLSSAACSGGDDEPLPDSAYVEWNASANGVVIKDWNNESFAVRVEDGVIARYSDDLMLNGLMAIGSSVYYNGNRIGTVTYTTSVNGGQITDFTCLNGLELDIMISSSDNSWSYTCR